jgi:hypothetical protein
VWVYDAGEAELNGREISYIVMEYVPAGSLRGSWATIGRSWRQRTRGSGPTSSRASPTLTSGASSTATSSPGTYTLRGTGTRNGLASPSGENPTGELWGGWTIIRQKIVVFRMKIRGRHQTRPPLVKAERAVLDTYDQKSFARAEQSGSIVGVPLRTPAERDGYRRTAGLARRHLHFHLHDIYPVPEVLAVGG